MKQLTLLPIFLLVLLSCSKKTETVNTAPPADSTASAVTLTDDQVKLLNIQTTKTERRKMSGAVKANGMLDVPPQNLVTISAPLGGFVKYTELLQGMKVQKGQVVVILEHPDYIQMQQDYLDSKSQLEFLGLEYSRQQELAKENVNAVKTLQQSKSNFLSTQAKVEGLKAKLKLINIDPIDIEKGVIKNTISIPSPITGYVTQININIGMHVNPTDVMLKIVDTDHLHAEAQVFEKDLTKLVVGQLVRIRLSNETKERLAKVYLIGKEITPERTVRVHCHLEVEDKSLIPGMYFSAIIETDQKSSQALPNDAIVNYSGKYFVFVVNEPAGHHFEMVEIQKGVSEDGYTSVVLPSTAMDKSIVSKGTYSLLGMLKNKED
jgi:cobalt-zinc-cadmium efflux system membrane fusion protein